MAEGNIDKVAIERNLSPEEVQAESGKLIKEFLTILKENPEYKKASVREYYQETPETSFSINGVKYAVDDGSGSGYLSIKRTENEKTEKESSEILLLQYPFADQAGLRKRPIISFQSETQFTLDPKDGLRKPVENTTKSLELAEAFKGKLAAELLTPALPK